MKTAKSSIKDQLGRYLVDLAIIKIESWATKEFEKLRRTAKFPVCVPLNKDSWAVGTHQIDRISDANWKVTKDEELVHIFYSKKAAAFYALLYKMGYSVTAELLKECDQTIAKIYDELEFYNKKISKTSSKSDEFKYQLRTVRRHELRLQYDAAQHELEKKLRAAQSLIAKILQVN
jgi:hypothetical protein